MGDVYRDGAVNATDMDEIVSKFRRNPEVLAEWASASHIHRTPRKGPENTTPPEPPPRPDRLNGCFNNLPKNTNSRQ